MSLARSQALGDRDEGVERGAPAPYVGLGVVHGHDGGGGADEPLLLPNLQLWSATTLSLLHAEKARYDL